MATGFGMMVDGFVGFGVQTTIKKRDPRLTIYLFI